MTVTLLLSKQCLCRQLSLCIPWHAYIILHFSNIIMVKKCCLCFVTLGWRKHQSLDTRTAETTGNEREHAVYYRERTGGFWNEECWRKGANIGYVVCTLYGKDVPVFGCGYFCKWWHAYFSSVGLFICLSSNICYLISVCSFHFVLFLLNFCLCIKSLPPDLCSVWAWIIHTEQLCLHLSVLSTWCDAQYPVFLHYLKCLLLFIVAKYGHSVLYSCCH